MSGHGSHAILVLPIPFEVPNRPNATWIPVKKKKCLLQQMTTAGLAAFP